MKRLLITICGRAGSKGFKNKNLKNFCGKPLVYYSLSAAELFIKKHPELEIDVALNTDSEDLARLVAAEYPEVIYLPAGPSWAGTACRRSRSTRTALPHGGPHRQTVRCYDRSGHHQPLRTEQDIENAFAKAQQREDLQIIFSVCEARRNPWFNMFKIVGDHAEMVIESQFTGRQQAPEVYDVNASIYVIRRAFLVDNPDPILWHSKFGVSVMMDTGIIDIDSEHDYLLMEPSRSICTPITRNSSCAGEYPWLMHCLTVRWSWSWTRARPCWKTAARCSARSRPWRSWPPASVCGTSMSMF